MKKVVIFMLIVGFGISLLAQQKEKGDTVPDIVKAAFQKDYPKVITE